MVHTDHVTYILISDWLILGLDLLDMRLDGEVVRTFLPRTTLGIFTVKAMFTQVILPSDWSKIAYITYMLIGQNHIHYDNDIFFCPFRLMNMFYTITLDSNLYFCFESETPESLPGISLFLVQKELKVLRYQP